MRRTHPLWLGTAFAFLTAVVIGCGGSSTTPPPSPSTGTADGGKHDHDDHDDHDDEHHEKAGMMMVHLGKHHAYLTAHLSKDGNELDLFLETSDKKPSPLAIPLARITGTLRKAGEEKEQELVFEPAPATERPRDEKAGTASHYVARVPALKADDTYEVTAEVELDGRKRRLSWKGFIPKKFSHHHD
jgi:hypothetical protein